MRVKCLDQEHNLMSLPGLKTQTAQSKSLPYCTNHEAITLPVQYFLPIKQTKHLLYLPVEHIPDSSLWLSWKIMYRGSPTHESLTGELREMTADIFDSCDDVSCCSVPRT